MKSIHRYLQFAQAPVQSSFARPIRIKLKIAPYDLYNRTPLTRSEFYTLAPNIGDNLYIKMTRMGVRRFFVLAIFYVHSCLVKISDCVRTVEVFRKMKYAGCIQRIIVKIKSKIAMDFGEQVTPVLIHESITRSYKVITFCFLYEMGHKCIVLLQTTCFYQSANF